MLGPEVPERGSKSPKTLGGCPVTIYLMSENVDQNGCQGPQGRRHCDGSGFGTCSGADRCGVVIDPDGYAWMVSTHVASPTPQEMAKAMKAMKAGA